MDSLGSDLDLLAPRDAHPDLHRLDNCWPQHQQLRRRSSEVASEDEELTNIARHSILEMRDNLDIVLQDLNQTNLGEKEKREQTNTNINSIKIAQTTTEIEHQEDQEETGGSEEMLNDDEAFVAWFTDASSDFNNDPTTRCYVNKLYQPMNTSAHNQHQPDDGSTLVEQEDEYLLLCEEINRLERADERQQVQLPKILDDEDDDPIGQHHHHHHHHHHTHHQHHHHHEDGHEDPLDRLQLTTIIESFDSFPSSPLIGSCHDRDPLISEACHRQDKPDSTKSAEMSPSADSNNLNSHHHNQHQPSQQQYDCDQQFDLNQKLQDDQDSHFLSSISSDNLLSNDSHSYHQHQQVLKDHHHNQDHQHLATQHQDQQQQHLQQHQETSSEISCFQQVSTTYMPALLANSSSEMASPVPSLSPYNNSRQSPCLTIEQRQTNGVSNKKESTSEGKQARKRCLHQSNDVDETKAVTIKEETGVRVNLVKKKRGNGIADDVENSSQLHNVSSTMTNDAKIKTKNQKTISTTNTHRQEHIITNSRASMVLTEEADDHSTVEEEDCNSTGSDGQPQMTKYRRRTANARERIRMREINQAFERLKKVVPLELIHTVSGDESDASTSRRGSSKSGQQHSDLQSPVKLTKITTLRLAVSYIAKLSEVLSQHPEGCPMTIPSSELGNNSEANSQDEKSKEFHSSFASKGGLTRKRRSRANSSRSRKVIDETLVKKGIPLQPVETAKVKLVTNDDKAPEKKLEKTYLLTQSENQNRQIIFTGNMLQQQQQHNQNTFNQPQQHISRQPQQFAYVNCHQQPLTISQTTSSNNNGQQQQNRTLVTPVAVAILGIQTAGNNQGIGDGQPLQILGIQQAGAAQQLHQRPASQQLQQASIPYNLIAQQPQQVTFTLGHDMNGMSVLRLAQPSQDGPQAQLQQSRPIIQQQPQILATTTASGYNYTTYQPIQISQLQTSSTTTTAQINNNSNSTTLMQNQRGSSTLQFRGACGEISNISNNSGVGGNDANLCDGTLSTTTTTATSPSQQQQQQHSLVAMKTMPVTNTGNNKSDCNNFSISPTLIAQHLNSNNNMVQGTQINFHQQSSDCSNQQILPRNLVPITSANHHQFFQATTTANHVVTAAPNTGQSQTANIIYLNPTRTTSNFVQPLIHTQQPMNSIYGQQQSLHESKANITTAGTAATTTTTSTSSGPFEQIKFVTQQFNSNSRTHEASYQNNEANIQQLVATLTTSIHPSANDSSQSKTNAEDQVGAGNELKQQQQAKRTYRFHNYDGNMITNHLYSSNHDKQQSQQQQSTTNSSNNNNNNNGNKQQQHHQHHHHQRGQQQSVQATGSGSNQISSQRSRQNSLSSTCSTTSSSSSSLISLSNASPLVSTPLVKSPNHENSNSTSSSSMSAQCMIEEEAAEAATAVVAGSRN